MRHLLIMSLLLAVTAACSSPVGPGRSSGSPAGATVAAETPASATHPTPHSPTPSAQATTRYTGLGLDTLGAYRATFEVHFSGPFDWVYRLETQADGQIKAYDLHVEGVTGPSNPGDVRVTVEDGIAKMRGPATDDECLQFPSDLALGLSFLTPDDLIPPVQIQDTLTPVESAVIAGIETIHYTLHEPQLGNWRDLEMDLWLAHASGGALRYEMEMIGPDPLFGAGDGRISGQFVVHEAGSQEIMPIAGCEIDLPLPPNATRIVRLPGLVAFDSVSGAHEIAAFYESALAEAGWTPLAEPDSGSSAILLSYRRGAQTLDINVEHNDQNTHVEMLLSEE